VIFSIVIPAKNEARDIGQCLESILAQCYDSYEVIVVDDGSTDETYKIVTHYATMYPEKIRISQSNGRGPGFAKNVGSEMAKGDIIFFLDADETINKEFLGYCKDYFTDSWVAGIVIALEFESVSTLGRIQGSWKTTRQCGRLGHFPRLMRKEIFESVGKYDADLVVGEDYDLWIKLKEFSENKKMRFVSEENAIIHHVDDDSLGGVFKSAIRFGRALMHTTERYPRFAGPIILWSILNALFLPSLLVFFSPFSWLSFIYFSIYILIWVYFILKIFIIKTSQTKFYIFLVPPLQVIIGLGVIIGLFESIYMKK